MDIWKLGGFSKFFTFSVFSFSDDFFVFWQVTFEKITKWPDLSKNNVVSLKISKTIVLELA